MKSLKVSVAAIAALLAGSALAQDSQEGAPAESQAVSQNSANQSAPAAEAEEDDPGEEVICRRERATGSLTRVNRICKTRNEWNGVHAATRDAFNDTVRGASGGNQCITLGNC